MLTSYKEANIRLATFDVLKQANKSQAEGNLVVVN